jgi:hypothetical protein
MTPKSAIVEKTKVFLVFFHLVLSLYDVTSSRDCPRMLVNVRNNMYSLYTLYSILILSNGLCCCSYISPGRCTFNSFWFPIFICCHSRANYNTPEHRFIHYEHIKIKWRHLSHAQSCGYKTITESPENHPRWYNKYHDISTMKYSR